MPSAQRALAAAIRSDDVQRARQLLRDEPELVASLNRPLDGLAFDAPAVVGAAHNRDMIDLLLAAGADINARSGWWAGGFGVLDSVDPALAPFLIERGARVDAHAAARLGMIDRLRTLVAADPAVVHARGGDGQTPLHFASTVAIAEFLLEHGADIDARDIDHESTPAQWMLGDRQDVARFLVARGCSVDILMATALGDLDRVRQYLDRDVAAVGTSVSDEYFPKQNPHAGGTIYIWTLGAHKTAHVIARERGHHDIFELLMARSPIVLQLAVACEVGDEPLVRTLASSGSASAKDLAVADRERIVAAAFGNNTDAVRLMLSVGWPSDVARAGGDTALHWAAWHGNVAMTRNLLEHRAPVDVRDRDHQATPLGWATYGSVHGWHPGRGDYAGTVDALIDAGADVPPITPALEVTDAVREVLVRRSRPR